MPRKYLTTAERGYGAAHKKARAATPIPYGSPCPFFGIDPKCTGPLVPVELGGEPLDFDHSESLALNPTSTADRWAHRSCNRRHGARLRWVLAKGLPLDSPPAPPVVRKPKRRFRWV